MTKFKTPTPAEVLEKLGFKLNLKGSYEITQVSILQDYVTVDIRTIPECTKKVHYRDCDRCGARHCRDDCFCEKCYNETIVITGAEKIELQFPPRKFEEGQLVLVDGVAFPKWEIVACFYIPKTREWCYSLVGSSEMYSEERLSITERVDNPNLYTTT